MDIATAEKILGMTFPERHRQAMLDPNDPIHEAREFLVLNPKYELLDLILENESLHFPNRFEPWPAYLVAFASNGCGDYFAYDLRTSPPVIRYVEPIGGVSEMLECQGKEGELVFKSFEDWYAYSLKLI